MTCRRTVKRQNRPDREGIAFSPRDGLVLRTTILAQRKLIGYLFVGAVAASVDMLVFFALVKKFGLHYLLANPFSFVFATLTNYALSVRLVFSSGVRFARHIEVAAVFSVSAIGLLLNQIVLYIGVTTFQLDLAPAKIVAIGAVFVWNYLMRSRFIFSPKNR